MIEIKSVNGAPDLEFWHLLKRVLNYLDVGGMSSEENDVENHAGYLRNIFKVKFCAWHSSIITDYLRIVDDAAESSKGTRGNPGLPRVRSVEVGQSGPPRGLPRKMFDEEWLAAQERRPDYDEEVLGISADVFEFMVAATSSMAG
jgi:hypothetical protein